MTALRRLAVATLTVSVLHVIFGAIVRITGSGFGCGDHWPRCHGYWFPPLNRLDLVIEVMHRYLAAGLSAMIVVLLVTAYVKRAERGVGGPGGVLRPALLAAALVVTAALFGAAIVKLELRNRYVVVAHLALAMSLVATLVAAAIRAGALGGSAMGLMGGSARAARGALAAAILGFIVLVMGALTANLPGAATACIGFPLCENGFGAPMQHVQLTHRVLAFLLVLHTMGLLIAVHKRREPPMIRRAAAIAFLMIVAQVVVAALLVETGLPLALRSAHQAVGTLVWVALVALALLARRSASPVEASVPTFVATPVPRPRPALGDQRA